MECIIRKRQKEDCNEIAHIITIEWNSTYKGIVPNYFLEELIENEEGRVQKAKDEFDENNNNILVAVVDGRIVGFSNYGVTDDPDFPNCAELRALYVYDDYHGYGCGRKLVEATKEEMKKLGYNKMIICCLKGNPANEFYKHIGGVYAKDGIYKRLSLKENIYYFDKI